MGLSDTTGYANPAQVRRLFGAVAKAAGSVPLAAHFHDTRGLGIANVTVGNDFRFGAHRQGDAALLEELGQRYGFGVTIAPLLSFDGVEVSSTAIRRALAEGRPRDAAAMLGHLHRIAGPVIHGDKLGRQIGFPTANLDHTAGMIPRHGVYAAWLTVLDPCGNVDAAELVGRRMPAAVSLGMNYTVGGTDLRIEAYVIDVEGLHLYDVEVALDLVEWRRPMLDFGSVEALVQALAEDVDWCRRALAAEG